MDTGVAAAAHGAATSPAANTPAGAGSLMSPPPPKRPRSSPPGSGGDARAATAAGAARGSVEDIEDDGGSGSDEEQPSFVQHDVGDAAPRGAAAAPIDGGSSSSDDEDDAGATDDDDDDGTDYVPVTVDSRRDRDGRTEYYVSWKGAKNMSQEIYCYYEVLALLNGFLDGFGVASKSRVVLWVWWLNPFQQFLQIMMLQPGQPFLEKLHFFSTSLYPMSPRFSGLPQCS